MTEAELKEIQESRKVVCRCSHSACRVCDEDMINACLSMKNGGDGRLE